MWQSNQPSPVLGSRRGKPGRPKKTDAPFIRPIIDESGHNPGTAPHGSRMNSEEQRSAAVQQASVPRPSILPRLLDLKGAAVYLGLSEWTVRDLEHSGTLARVRIPLPKHGELRKLLFDRQDLDALIEVWKDGVAHG